MDETDRPEKAVEDNVQMVAPVAPLEEEMEYLTGPKLWAILTGIALVTFTVMLDASIITTAIPLITDEFHSLLDVAWYGASYQLASASFQPFTGKLYTHLHLKWTYLAFFLVFEIGSLLCALAKTSKMFIVARAVAGLGASGLLNGGLTMVSSFLPKHKRPAVIGTLMSLTQLGLACGPLIGGVFTQKVTWRWCFYLNLPIGGLVLALLVCINIPNNTNRLTGATLLRTLLPSLDILGFVLFAPAMIMLFLALDYGGNQYAWNSPTVIGLFCGFAGMLVVCLCWEYRHGDDAMLPFSILRQRIMWSSCASSFFMTGASISGSYFLPIFFQAVMNNSPIRSGVYFLPNVLTQATFTILSGVLVQVLGYYMPAVLIGNAIAAIGYGLLSLLTPTYPIASRVGFQILVGAGLGTANSQPMVAVQNIIPQNQMSVAMAVLVFCFNLGASCFLQFSVVTFTQGLLAALPKYAPKVDPRVVIQAGATGFRKVVPEHDIPGVLLAYSEGIRHVFYLVSAGVAMAFVFGLGMGWKNVRKVEPKHEASSAA